MTELEKAVAAFEAATLGPMIDAVFIIAGHYLNAEDWQAVYNPPEPVVTAITKLHDQRANRLRFKPELE